MSVLTSDTISILTLIATVICAMFGLVAAVYTLRGFYRQWGKKDRVSHTPNTLDPNFVGRRSQLAEIRKHHRPWLFWRRKKTVFVTGPGGIGKSSVALEYARRHQKNYGHRIWINAETNETIQESLRNAAAEFAQAGYSGFSGRQSLKLSALKPHNAPTLLLIDNLDSPPIGLEFVGYPGSYDILVTSRFDSWPIDATVVSLGAFSRRQSITYLRALTGLDDPTGADQLARRLGDYPLALNHAGSTISESAGWTYKTYIERFNDVIKKVPETATYNTSIFTTFSLAIEQTGFDLKNSVVQLIGVMGADAIDKRLVKSSLQSTHTEQEIEDVLAALEKRSILRRTSTDVFRIHRVIQDVISMSQPKQELERTVGILLEGISLLVPGSFSDHNVYKEATPLLAAMDRVTSISDQRNEVMVSLFSKILSAHTQWGDLDTAKVYYDLLIREFETANVSQEARASMLNNLGGYLQVSNAHAESEVALSEAVKLTRQFEQDASPDDLNKIRIELGVRLNNLARTYQFWGAVTKDQSKFDHCLRLFRESIRVTKMAAGSGSALHLRRINNVAMAYKDMGRTRRALSLLDLINREHRKRYGEDETYGIRQRNFGQVLFELGHVGAALMPARKGDELLQNTERRLEPLLTHAAVASALNHPSISELCERLEIEAEHDASKIGFKGMAILRRQYWKSGKLFRWLFTQIRIIRARGNFGLSSR